MPDPDFCCMASEPPECRAGDNCASCGQTAVMTLIAEHKALPVSRILSIRRNAVDLLAITGPRPGALVQIECSDVLIFGEVVRVEPQPPSWKVTVGASDMVRRSAIGPFFAPRPQNS